LGIDLPDVDIVSAERLIECPEPEPEPVNKQHDRPFTGRKRRKSARMRKWRTKS
jgi:hypothetical protein